MQEQDVRAQTCCLIGPRGLCREALADVTPRLYRALSQQIMRNGISRFYCGMDDAFDRAAAQAVLQMRGGHPQVRFCLYGDRTAALSPPWQRICAQAETTADDLAAALAQSAFCLACTRGHDAYVRAAIRQAREHGARITRLGWRPSWLL